VERSKNAVAGENSRYVEATTSKQLNQAGSLLNKQQYEVIQSVHEHKRKAHVFKEREKLNDINRENTKILNKLVEISKGKLVSSKIPKIII
jgi:hypothetical protein